MLTLPVSMDYAVDTFCLTNEKVRSLVRKSLKINGYIQKLGVIYESNIYMTNRDNFKIGPFFKLTLEKFE